MDESAGPQSSSGKTHLLGSPPLRIHHFLAATVVAAVLLSIAYKVQRGESPFLASVRTPGGLAATIATAVSLTLGSFGFWWRWEGRRFFNQPGHWLLLARALDVRYFVAASLFSATQPARGNALLSASYLATTALVFGMSLWVVFRVADTKLWRAYFLVAAVTVLANPWMYWVTGIRSYMTAWSTVAILLFALLAAAAIGDRIGGRTRDWPHWVGVLMRLCLLAVLLLQYAVQWLVEYGWIGPAAERMQS